MSQIETNQMETNQMETNQMESKWMDSEITAGDALAGQVSRFAQERAVKQQNRRKFLATLGAGAAGTMALAGGLTGCNESGTVPVVSLNPLVDVLNYALNLEYFEASFYLFVTTGNGLPSANMGSAPGTVTGGAKVSFVNTVVGNVATQLATDELEHVQFLQSTIASIGGTPVSIPNINLAAGGAVTSDATFLAAARRFETVGISAYAGGAASLVTSTQALTYAAQILHTEAQHEGFLRQLCINLGVASPAVDSLDLPPTSAQVFNTNANGLNAVRTTSQVLQILYAAPGQTGVTSGGFFPNGLNGNIRST